MSQLSESEYKKEFKKLTIDLSCKSSQIEGNTYSLIETVKLLFNEQNNISHFKAIFITQFEFAIKTYL